MLVEQKRNGRRATRGGQSRARLELVECDRRRGAHGERNAQALRSERLLHPSRHPLGVVAALAVALAIATAGSFAYASRTP